MGDLTYDQIIDSACYQRDRAMAVSPVGHLLDEARAVWIVTPQARMIMRRQLGQIAHDAEGNTIFGIPIRVAGSEKDDDPPILLVMPPRLA